MFNGQFSVYDQDDRFELHYAMTFRDKRTYMLIPNFYIVFSYLIGDLYTDMLLFWSLFIDVIAIIAIIVIIELIYFI